MEENLELRVVALQGAAAEVLCALELQHLLIGRSHECTYPPEILSLPCLSCISPEDQALLASDFKEQRFIREALAPFQVNLKLLKELKPNVIITQDRCEACGGGLDELQKACGRLIFGDDKRCRLLSLKPLMIEDIFQNIQSVANVCYSSGKGKKLVANLKTRWKHAMQRSPQWADGVPRINVACLQWLEPLIGAGYWIPEIVACAGGFNMFGDVGHHSPVISWPEFMHADPDVIIIVCLGLNIERASSVLALLQNANQWRQLRAVIAKRVYVVNGERYFNLPGTTVVDSAELVVEILYGSRNEQTFLYHGNGYVRWEVRNNVEHAVPSNGLQSLARRSNQGTVGAEDLEGEHAGRRGILEDCLMEKEVQNGRVTFVSHMHSDSDSTVSSEKKASVLASSRKGNGWDDCCEEGHVGYNKSASMFRMNSSKRNKDLVDNRSKTGRRLDFSSSSILDSLAEISLADSNPSALKVIGEVSGQQYSGHSMDSTLTDQASPSLHEGRFADAVDQSSGAKLVTNVRHYAVPPTLEMDFSACYTKDPTMHNAGAIAKRSCETSPVKGSPFSAGRSSNARSSWASISSSGTLSEKEVLSKMWASTEAAAKCQSSEALRGSIKRGKYSHDSAKIVPDCVDIATVYKLVVGTDVQLDKRSEEVKNNNATSGRKRCRAKHPQADPSLNKKPMGAVQNGTNAMSKSFDCTLRLRNSKLSVFSQKALALRNLIFKAVKELPFADCLLLSGGLGSTILAEAAQLAFPKSYRIGVTVLAGPDAKDKHFSPLISKEYDMKHIVVGGGDKGNPVDLLEMQLDFVVETLQTFNPSEIQKAIALAAALREAKRLGFSSVVTGDGADELFAGHYCMQSMTEDEFDCYRYQQISSMTYSSVSLGTAVGIKVGLASLLVS
ncbi:hypothetical protein O6H91_02G019800 [Diphasiastrum complanatum]|uniref:Uncharacterized protein n=1 Tax=Diphasiastrum complanatum TaxID=34168 RepID=A0ACC2EDE2_DIPCM|nr:hypothetical protein O6H91_02G019800 [Diphasiastrum complanatum]